MHPQTCAKCGGSLRASHDPVTMQVRGETVSVAGVKHVRCGECGEAYLDPSAIRQFQQEAASQVRSARGLLQPDEIKAIRERLGLSQARFETLLGVGEKTVIRWERGTVYQSATADRLMRLIRDVPQALAALQGAPSQAQFQVSVPVRAGRGGGWEAHGATAAHLEVVQDDSPARAA